MSTAVSPSNSPAAAPAVAGRTRHGAIDVLRIAAVVPIVFYHGRALAQLPALIGMHALIAAAVFFAARPSRLSAGSLIVKRASRLLVPWLVYALWHLFTAARNHILEPWMFFIGGSLHLWFVPFIFLVTVAVALACRERGWPAGRGRMLLFTALALGAIHAEARYTPVLLSPAVADWFPAWQFLDGGTAALIALAVLSTPLNASGRAAFALLIALASLPLWLPWRTPGMMAVSPAGFGTLLFVLVGLLPAGANRLTDFLGRASFGLYLMHIVVLYSLWKWAAKLTDTPVDSLSLPTHAVCAAAAICLCLPILAVADRTPVRRVLM